MRLGAAKPKIATPIPAARAATETGRGILRRGPPSSAYRPVSASAEPASRIGMVMLDEVGMKNRCAILRPVAILEAWPAEKTRRRDYSYRETLWPSGGLVTATR